MHYTLYQKQERKIPGIAVIVALIVVTTGLAFLLRKDTVTTTTQDTTILERVDIANIRDTSATVFWRTSMPTQGYVMYGSQPGALSQKAYDERDIASRLSKRRNHVVTLANIPSQKDIYFQLVVDEAVLGQSAGIPFTAKTGRPLTSALDLEPIYGEVSRQSGSLEKEAVVILTISKAKPLLTQTNEDGTFLFAPCCLYNVNSGEPVYPAKDESVRMEIVSEDGTSKLLESTLASVSPLQQTIIVDSKDDVVQIAQTDRSSNTAQPEVLAASDSIIKFDPVDIIFPRDQASIPGTRPLVRGVGEPNEIVKGKFPEANRLFQVEIDEDRNWLYQPSFDFAPGDHTLIVSTRNAQGQPVQLSRSFSILKSGEAVLGDATGSATLTPTLFPTPETTATPSPTTVELTPTPPVTGISIIPFALISLVLIVIGAGIVLLF
jgi:hypothetical protein